MSVTLSSRRQPLLYSTWESRRGKKCLVTVLAKHVVTTNKRCRRGLRLWGCVIPHGWIWVYEHELEGAGEQVGQNHTPDGVWLRRHIFLIRCLSTATKTPHSPSHVDLVSVNLLFIFTPPSTYCASSPREYNWLLPRGPAIDSARQLSTFLVAHTPQAGSGQTFCTTYSIYAVTYDILPGGML